MKKHQINNQLFIFYKTLCDSWRSRMTPKNNTKITSKTISFDSQVIAHALRDAHPGSKLALISNRYKPKSLTLS